MKTRKVVPADWEAIAKAFAVPADEVRAACPSLAAIVCPGGTKIVREAEPGVDVFILGKGSLVVRRSRFAFLSKDVARLKPGDFFGEVGFLVDQGRTATVACEGPCEVYRILAAEMQELLEKHADLRQRLEEAARQRIQALSAAVS